MNTATRSLSVIAAELPPDGQQWQQILADLITDPKELLALLQLDAAAIAGSTTAMAQFPLRVPRPYAGRMEQGNRHDPLLRQVWPDLAEAVTDPLRSPDPLQEAGCNPAPGLLHKYRGRVLLTASPHCAIHCRYCFRRHFDYRANTPGQSGWRQALDYIADHPGIDEVIVSGGDPLAATDSYLAGLLAALERIPHVQTLRLHTRLPIVIPQRINSTLRSVLRRLHSRLVVVIHSNHANELDQQVGAALQALRDDGHVLLNQSVLLRGVNDNAASLIALNRRLFSHGVLPYYLHLPDAVAGTGHFDVSETRGRQLLRALQRQLPGYLVPTLVREQPGHGSKTRIA